jgi:hypothetical protein
MASPSDMALDPNAVPEGVTAIDHVVASNIRRADNDNDKRTNSKSDAEAGSGAPAYPNKPSLYLYDGNIYCINTYNDSNIDNDIGRELPLIPLGTPEQHEKLTKHFKIISKINKLKDCFGNYCSSSLPVERWDFARVQFERMLSTIDKEEQLDGLYMLFTAMSGGKLNRSNDFSSSEKPRDIRLDIDGKTISVPVDEEGLPTKAPALWAERTTGREVTPADFISKYYDFWLSSDNPILAKSHVLNLDKKLYNAYAVWLKRNENSEKTINFATVMRKPPNFIENPFEAVERRRKADREAKARERQSNHFVK